MNSTKLVLLLISWCSISWENARNCKYDAYQKALASMAYKIFDKKTGSGASVNEHLPKELHKPAIKNFKKRKVYARFKDYARIVRQ